MDYYHTMPEPGMEGRKGVRAPVCKMKRIISNRPCGRWIRRGLLAVLLTALFVCLVSVACADEIPIKVGMKISPNTFTAPGKTTVSISISNTTDRDLPGPITLYYPNNEQVEDFGEVILAAGATKTWTGTWDVTQDQLEAGRIAFRINYSMYTDDGEIKNRSANLPQEVIFNGVVASVEVNRKITPTMAGRNQEVSVTYEIVNTGNVDITDVTIVESTDIAKSSARVGNIVAGAKGTHTFTTKMGSKDKTSSATITYKAGGATYSVTKEPAVIKYGEMHLSATLTADKKGGLVGDSVKLTLQLKNTGKVNYENITVSDGTLGDLWTGQSVPAGEVLTLDTTVPVERTTDYQLIITGTGADGSSVETATGRVTVTAVEPSQMLNLLVDASVDQEQVYSVPAVVKFTISVTNTSSSDVSNVAVQANGQTLYTFASLLAGETKSFTREASVVIDSEINYRGDFQFAAVARNMLNESETFYSNTVRIEKINPTPVPTDAPIVTPPAPQYEDLPTAEDLPTWYREAGTALNWATIVLAALAAIGLIIVIIGFIVRAVDRSREIPAVDNLDRIKLLEKKTGSEEDGDSGEETKA